ncbi:hypothetical protein BU24DRAFT_416856 [Aaosphaeria arxii CBS 175.79]|uniref:Zn(2)-C6 fungal-type domain-containing protein n=1 Tax=Aaosphaeria arxii CBS 175.79 TaxID=1450172 RepID=A0A6A5Y8P7_9PLEO|nr:uncharacterized protein BU24DRAFT_416856 [Aaosphaeria arxii CBS 175.79]KAF2021190.1 hypothetical protein BU24DRAFT_416856 [Aaosphaeria arxii CBS 175.79]
MSSTPRTSSQRLRLRVTTGCQTCRRRHVKCDESKPTCRNCGKKNRVCRYDNAIESREPSEARTTIQHPSTITDTSDSPMHDLRPANRDPPVLSNDEVSLTPSNTSVITPVPVSNNPDLSITASETVPRDSHVEASGGEARNAEVEASNLEEQDTPIARESLVIPAPSFDPEDGTLHQISPRHSSLAAVLPGLRSSSLPDPGTSHSIGGFRVDKPISLDKTANIIFFNYVQRLSHWVDSFSDDRPFHLLVPSMALTCPALLDACLAVSAKQMMLVGYRRDICGSSVVLHYYRLALQGMNDMLDNPTSAKSEEVLASSILLSTYEMLDVIGESFGSHLGGITSLLRAQNINGGLKGIAGGAYWTWYRHEVWAALHTPQRVALDEMYWRPDLIDSFEHLSVEGIANRVLFIFGQCINHCHTDPLTDAYEIERRELWRTNLKQELESWNEKRPLKTMPLSNTSGSNANGRDSLEHPYSALQFMYPQSAIAHQMYHASHILLALHEPPSLVPTIGISNLHTLNVRRQIEHHRQQVVAAADSGIGEAWSLLSTQCLYVAGLVTDGQYEREHILYLIEDCQSQSGRRTVCIANILRSLWAG